MSSRLVAACLALGLVTIGTTGRAVVGGREDDGPLARSTVMVLSSRGGVCSAVAVADDVVLSAAHCVAGADQVRIHFKRAGASPALLEPKAIVLHPGFVPGAVAARRRSVDLALLRLGEALPPSFGPAILSGTSPAAEAPLTLGGYGVSREKEARTTGTFRSASLVKVEPHGPGRILLWARSADGEARGACDGDSGGPIADHDGVVVAITSWVTGEAGRRCGALSQGVLVGPQRGWIAGTLTSWGRSADWR